MACAPKFCLASGYVADPSAFLRNADGSATYPESSGVTAGDQQLCLLAASGRFDANPCLWTKFSRLRC